MTLLTHDLVATHAYFAWEAEGRPHGRHEHHWFSAEAALTRAEEPMVAVVGQTAPVVEAVEAVPAKAPAVKKAAAPRKPAQPKAAASKAAAPKATAGKAPAETVVAAAALATPRAARSTAKGARRAH